VTESPSKLSVSGLVELLQDVVETNFVTVTVEGEISNFAAPASGHWYFTLKDSGAQLRGCSAAETVLSSVHRKMELRSFALEQ
jgi:exonuclease VII large subunit